MRVVVADDVMLVRSGLTLLLRSSGIEVAGEASNAADLLRLVEAERPDVAIVDIRMPPTQSDEGIVAAHAIRDGYPSTGVVLLSQHLELRYAERLLAEQPEGMAYLLKERVSNIGVLLDALERVAQRECVLDPSIVQFVMRRKRARSPLDRLTPRELDVLTAMAEGRSNSGIATTLGISERTVESTSAQVFAKLELESSPHDNRRVLAVLKLLST